MTTQSIGEDNIHSLYIVDENVSKIKEPLSLKQEIYSNNTLIKSSLDQINKTVRIMLKILNQQISNTAE